ncbi:NnrU family protein [Alkalimonas sp.]|uniref:NnrU family protein n=1 Tax=Alkalimonas sp. TaxID=1872453 RepID=UPI00263BA92F|nr:NnrU family protein [Alkalimonas sp.]MCC5825338.1 NnrU family protein [Alkalimonas sp.]
MVLLLAGLVLFLGIHSSRMLAPEWRVARINQWGSLGWKGVYALISLTGFVLLVLGYSAARQSTGLIWLPPHWMGHLTALLTLFAFILLAATYVPGSWLKAKVGHPMLLATKIWALSHLLSNGTTVAVLLFGSFLVWSVACYAISRRCDRAENIQRTGLLSRDLASLLIGIVLFWLFAFHLHEQLIGVKPFGG